MWNGAVREGLPEVTLLEPPGLGGNQTKRQLKEEPSGQTAAGAKGSKSTRGRREAVWLEQRE